MLKKLLQIFLLVFDRIYHHPKVPINDSHIYMGSDVRLNMLPKSISNESATGLFIY